MKYVYHYYYSWNEPNGVHMSVDGILNTTLPILDFTRYGEIKEFLVNMEKDNYPHLTRNMITVKSFTLLHEIDETDIQFK